MEPLQNVVLRGHPIDWALIILFGFLFLFHLAYILIVTRRAAYHKNPPADNILPVSLLLVVKNEEENLSKNLKPFLIENKGDYEVVAVDNFSQDESLSVLNALQGEHPRLKITSLKQYTPHSEKMAHNIALKAAKHQWVILIPPSADLPKTQWLTEVSSRLNSSNVTVVNYSNLAPQKGFFNLLYRVEYFFQQIKSFGFITNRAPFVVSQENVAFQKMQYFEVGGYRGKISEPFANLELVINSFIRKRPVSLILSPDTSIQRKEDVRWKDYLELIKKEIYIRKHLPRGIRFLLVLYEWANLLFAPVAAVLVIRIPDVWPFVTGAIIGLIVCNLVIIKKLLSRLQEFKLFLPSFLIALFLPFFKIAFRIYYLGYGKKKEWKIGI